MGKFSLITSIVISIIIGSSVTYYLVSDKNGKNEKSLVEDPSKDIHETISVDVNSNTMRSNSTKETTIAQPKSVVGLDMNALVSNEKSDHKNGPVSAVLHDSEQERPVKKLIGDVLEGDTGNKFANMESLTDWPGRAEIAITNTFFAGSADGINEFDGIAINELSCKDHLCMLAFYNDGIENSEFKQKSSELLMKLLSMNLNNPKERGMRSVKTDYKSFSESGLVKFYISRGVGD